MQEKNTPLERIEIFVLMNDPYSVVLLAVNPPVLLVKQRKKSGRGSGLMYLHLGQNEIVSDHRIIGIFDLGKCSYDKRSGEYLRKAEEEGVVLDVSGDIPKSFVICDHPYHAQIVYLCQLNSATLQKRAESGRLEL